MSADLRVSPELAAALADLEEGCVFAPLLDSDEWDAVATELTSAFEMSRAAVQQGRPVVYVVVGDDLLGKRGPGRAMVATGLLSGARTAAVETRKAGVPFNVLAVEPETDAATIAAWVRRLLEPGGPTGELVHIGGTQLGKALV